jgi:hypothetical protein
VPILQRARLGPRRQMPFPFLAMRDALERVQPRASSLATRLQRRHTALTQRNGCCQG